MIEQQVRTWDVLDARVLETLSAVPREKFVPEAYRQVAFADAPIPIGHGQFMLMPALEGRILQALAPVRGERTLEIGTGSGFFAACLAHLTGSVDSIEIHADLAAGAARAIGELGISRVAIETGDALAREYDAAYEVVAVTGSLARAGPPPGARARGRRPTFRRRRHGPDHGGTARNEDWRGFLAERGPV